MKRKTVAAMGALALIVGGCSSGDGAQEQEQVSAAPEQTQEELFIEASHETVPESKALDDDDLVAYGEVVCEALDAGISLPELALFIGNEVQNEEVAGMLGALGGTAVATLCPEVME